MLTVDEETKQQIKQNKLRQLSYQHYEIQLQKIVHQARGEELLATQAGDELARLEAAYNAIDALL
ncbi:hypothetical protein [Paenibacillus radicis (ex Xue et al. 2023)]|uniref:Uncharacterized protein n=1 Tax=Paenibacillus radicis (ex Xue et al. 2023) TaxID=2972489 RepID=A0ABT1YK07_9BACL|nr:hypothetical protein [Paenibacillus radicis (ex Xue et al. 2023)]MCR8633504.1 hypothetical protein [Paenibacillus radicis (ex Xue et al. 2023)]